MLPPPCPPAHLETRVFAAPAHLKMRPQPLSFQHRPKQSAGPPSRASGVLSTGGSRGQLPGTRDQLAAMLAGDPGQAFQRHPESTSLSGPGAPGVPGRSRKSLGHTAASPPPAKAPRHLLWPEPRPGEQPPPGARSGGPGKSRGHPAGPPGGARHLQLHAGHPEHPPETGTPGTPAPRAGPRPLFTKAPACFQAQSHCPCLPTSCLLPLVLSPRPACRPSSCPCPSSCPAQALLPRPARYPPRPALPGPPASRAARCPRPTCPAQALLPPAHLPLVLPACPAQAHLPPPAPVRPSPPAERPLASGSPAAAGLTEIDVSEGAAADLAAEPVPVSNPQLHGGRPLPLPARPLPGSALRRRRRCGSAPAPPSRPRFHHRFPAARRSQRLNTGRRGQYERRRPCSGRRRPRSPSPRRGWTRIFRA